MPRFTAPTGSSAGELEDHEPYLVTLVDLAWTQGAEQYGSKMRAELTWQLDGGSENDTIKDWAGISLGIHQGNPSKFLQLLNALHEVAPNTPVKWFDSDTLEWGYEEDKPADKLEPGRQVILRGHSVVKDEKTRFRVDVYQSPKGAIKAQAAEPATRSAFGRPATAAPTPTAPAEAPAGMTKPQAQAAEEPIPF